MKRVVVLIGTIVSLTALPVLAQEEKASIKQRGEHSITLDVGYNTWGFGYWHKMSDQTDLGLDIDLSFRDSEHYKTQQYMVTPAVKRYFLADKTYSPYLYAGISGGYSKYDSDNSNVSERYSVGALGGFGLEWFPITNVSIGGHVGLRAEYGAQRDSYAPDPKEEGYSVSTFSSGLRFNMFF